MSKLKKHIIIRISKEGVFYNTDDCIPWHNTNFPPKTSFSFNPRNEIYWQAEMLDYEKSTGELAIKVVNYKAENEKERYAQQQPKAPVKSLKFSPLDWSELQVFLNFYTLKDFDDLVELPKREQANSETVFIDHNFVPKDVFGLKKPRKIDIQIKYPLIKTEFKTGYIQFEKKLKGIAEPLTITIENDHIIPQFDHIKPFFAKALGKKKIQVSGYAEIDADGEIQVNCQSHEISQINEDLITSVKKLKIENAIFKPKVIAIDKSVFTPTEYFGNEEEDLGNVFRENDDELLKKILDLKGVRNKKQLVYLSGKLHSNKIGLRFTLSPKFGFLFHVEGKKKDHFIWELLDTNATYIWSMGRGGISLEKKYTLLEKEINFIRDQGRMVYLQNENTSEFVFCRVKHDDSNSKLVDGFPKWKKKVNEKLI